MTTSPNHNTADQSGADRDSIAKAIYDAFEYTGAGSKPSWSPLGNSQKQDEARRYADAALSLMASTQPAPKRHELNERNWRLALAFAPVPVLYVDEINGDQTCRDDLWLATTDQLATPQPFPAPAVQSGDAHYSADDLANELAKIRNMFPVPSKGSPLEKWWAASMCDPMEVSEFVRKAIAEQTTVNHSLTVANTRPEPAVQNVQAGDGWKLVPVEPTPGMIYAMWQDMDKFRGQSENTKARHHYTLMLNAAPSQPVAGHIVDANKMVVGQPVAGKPEPTCKACDDEGVVHDEEGMKPCGACQDIDDDHTEQHLAMVPSYEQIIKCAAESGIFCTMPQAVDFARALLTTANAGKEKS